MYHRVLPKVMIPQDTGPSLANIVELEDFKDQLLWLETNYTVVKSTDESSKTQSSSKPQLLFTFDDGHLDSLEVIAPILEGRGIAGVYFLVSGYLDGAFRPWEERLWSRVLFWLNGDDSGFSLLSSLIPRQKFTRQSTKAWFKIRKYLLSQSPLDLQLALDHLELTALKGDDVHELMDWSNARSLQVLNHSSIGFHSHSHSSLAAMSAEEIEKDFVRGLEAFASQRVNLNKMMAYPFGRVSPFAADMLNKFGFERGYLSRWIHFSLLPLAQAYPRLFVGPSQDSAMLRRRINRAFDFLRVRESLPRSRLSKDGLGSSVD